MQKRLPCLSPVDLSSKKERRRLASERVEGKGGGRDTEVALKGREEERVRSRNMTFLWKGGRERRPSFPLS